MADMSFQGDLNTSHPEEAPFSFSTRTPAISPQLSSSSTMDRLDTLTIASDFETWETDDESVANEVMASGTYEADTSEGP